MLIYLLTVTLVLLAAGASAAILIIAAWDPDFRNFATYRLGRRGRPQ
jgi:hypothetical protein